MNINLLENEKIEEFYKGSNTFERIVEFTRSTWIANNLVPSDYTLERTRNFLLTMEKRFPHIVIFILHDDIDIAGWLGISKSDRGQLEIDRWHPITQPGVNDEKIFLELVKECLNYAAQHNYKDITISFAIDNENDSNLFNSYETRYNLVKIEKSYEMIFMALELSKGTGFSNIQSSNLQIASLVDVDKDEVAECIYQSFRYSKDRYFEKLSQKEVKEEFERRIDPVNLVNSSSIFLKDNSKIIGLGLVKNREFDTHFDLLCVHPDYRKKGYSTIIMKYIINSLLTQKVTSLTLGVDPVNFEAVSLYNKFGFKKINSIVELSYISS